MVTIKKLLIPTSLFIGLGLAGCGDEETLSEPLTKETVESEFGFVSFDLDIDTAETRDAVEASFDMDAKETEAEYVNRIESKELYGDDAYNYLKPIFKNLNLQKNMEQEEVIKKVLKEFNVSDYVEFELDIEYEDGSETEYRDKK